MNNISFSESTRDVKEEFEDVEDDKFVVREIIIAGNGELPDHVAMHDKIEQYETSTTSDNIKTELSSPQGQYNTMIDNVAIQEGIGADDVKIELDTGLVFCEDCRVYCQDYCTKCDMLLHVLNGNALNGTDDRTREELPNDILEIKESHGQVGVFSLKVIPKDVKFGPFVGLSALERHWKIKAGRFAVSEDESKLLNWMRHVNPAGSVFLQNLVPFQYDDSIYYRSTCEIQEGEELLVHFGEEYEVNPDNDTERDFVPVAEQCVRAVFACTFCCLGFSSKTYLMRHKAVCFKGPNRQISVEELTQCRFCQVFLGVKEYSNYHIARCWRSKRQDTPPIPDSQTVATKKGETRQLQTHRRTRCDYKTKYRGDLNAHAVQHCKVKTYKCRICFKRSKTKKILEMHVRNAHLNVAGEEQTRQHPRPTDGEKATATESEIRKKTDTPKESRFKCASCQFKTNYKWCLKIHTKTKHLREYSHKCEMCKYETTSKSRLETHARSKHLQIFDYECERCEFKTSLKRSLENHVRTKHLKEFRYVCELCGYETNYKRDFAVHTKSKHLKEFDYSCEACDYKTNHKEDLACHRKAKHLREFSYECEACAYKTNHKWTFENHVKTKHSKEFRYKCDACDFQTNQKWASENHVRTKHLGEFDYRCETCGYKTNQKTHLERHARTKHLKEYCYRCEACEFGTNQKSHLAYHVQTQHLREFDHKCETCEFITNHKSHLRQHVKRHHLVKEFSYACEMCEYKAKEKLCLDIHVKTKHLKEFDYKCATCEYKTNHKKNMERHIKTIHLR